MCEISKSRLPVQPRIKSLMLLTGCRLGNQRSSVKKHNSILVVRRAAGKAHVLQNNVDKCLWKAINTLVRTAKDSVELWQEVTCSVLMDHRVYSLTAVWNAMASYAHVRTSLGDHSRQRQYRLGWSHVDEQHTDILLRSSLLWH